MGLLLVLGVGVAEDFGMASDRVGVADFCVESIVVGVLASRPDSVFEGVLTSSVLGSLISVSGTAEGSAIEVKHCHRETKTSSSSFQN